MFKRLHTTLARILRAHLSAQQVLSLSKTMASADRIRSTIASLAVPTISDPDIRETMPALKDNLMFLLGCYRGRSDEEWMILRSQMLGAGILSKLDQVRDDLSRFPDCQVKVFEDSTAFDGHAR